MASFHWAGPPIPLIYKRYDHTKNVKTFPKIVVTYISYTHIGRHVVGDEKPSRFDLGGNPSAVWAIEEAAIMAKAQGAQLFVSRLSSYITTKEFKALFSRFGVVTDAKLITDPKTQRPKGFGFITFQSGDDAQKALKTMDGRIVNGRLIFVEVAKSRSPGTDASP